MYLDIVYGYISLKI